MSSVRQPEAALDSPRAATRLVFPSPGEGLVIAKTRWPVAREWIWSSVRM